MCKYYIGMWILTRIFMGVYTEVWIKIECWVFSYRKKSIGGLNDWMEELMKK